MSIDIVRSQLDFPEEKKSVVPRNVSQGGGSKEKILSGVGYERGE